MTDDEKKADAAKDQQIADLTAQLAKVGRGPDAGASGEDGDVRARAVREAEAMEATTPTPTQDELDQVKLGGANLDAAKAGAYKTRQTKAN